MQDAFTLEGELALITGGGSGLGMGMAECFVAAGAQVVIVGRRERVLADACRKLGTRAAYRTQDITAFDETRAMLEALDGELGTPSILVNNAGIHLKKSAPETTPEELGRVLNTHVIAAHNLTRLVLPKMVEKRHGSVLFIASMASLFGLPNVMAYSAAKAAYGGMVRSMASEVSPHGVRVNAIAPGWIDTPMFHRALDDEPERQKKILSRTPIGRFGDPEDIGWAAVYLCSPAAKFVTGVTLPIDGGASIGF